MTDKVLTAMLADGWRETDKELPPLNEVVEAYYEGNLIHDVQFTSATFDRWTTESGHFFMSRPKLWRKK